MPSILPIKPDGVGNNILTHRDNWWEVHNTHTKVYAQLYNVLRSVKMRRVYSMKCSPIKKNITFLEHYFTFTSFYKQACCTTSSKPHQSTLKILLLEILLSLEIEFAARKNISCWAFKNFSTPKLLRTVQHSCIPLIHWFSSPPITLVLSKWIAHYSFIRVE